MIAGGKNSQRNHVAGEVHDLGVGSRFGEIEPEAKHESHGPKRACAWSEETIIKPNAQTKYCIEKAWDPSGLNVQAAQLGLEKRVEHDRYQQPWNQQAQEISLKILHQQRARECANRGPNNPT